MIYKIYPVSLGTYWTDISKVSYLAAAGTRVKMQFGFFALEDEEGNWILVDSGCPTREQVEEENLPFPAAPDDGRGILQALGDLGVVAEEIRLIILTHLHWEHSWNLELFPNAEILVQRAEMMHAVTPYPHERNAYCMTEGTVGKGWTKGIMRIRPLEGDMEVREGLRVITLPGHTPGHQGVLVDTADGLYALAGDWAYKKFNVENRKAVGDVLDIYDWYRSYDKLQNYHATVLAPHDEDVYKQEVYG